MGDPGRGIRRCTRSADRPVDRPKPGTRFTTARSGSAALQSRVGVRDLCLADGPNILPLGGSSIGAKVPLRLARAGDVERRTPGRVVGAAETDLKRSREGCWPTGVNGAVARGACQRDLYLFPTPSA